MSRVATTPRRTLAVAAVLLTAVALTVGACSSDDDASPRSSSSVTTTSVPTPSTVSDADFESQATTAELMIRNAGSDACAVLRAFAPASSLPSPINPTQTERGVRVIVELFNTAAASAPPEAAADAAVLRQAGADLAAEGAAAGWAPNWLMQNPKALTTPEFIQAFTNYQSAVGTTCGPTTTAP
ncbi:hypothetical protein [Dermatobacter hominis]|uniref:hypothetical protein n=1 Tax=Dermatobacter hominis TaxID=2884263 RepID=UPI001D11CECA|nr:hypothetical protein [Dermatobacter hominis]UDY34752.1 hypothetical protein LH044_15590 [Dermatobacter hominis]